MGVVDEFVGGWGRGGCRYVDGRESWYGSAWEGLRASGQGEEVWRGEVERHVRRELAQREQAGAPDELWLPQLTFSEPNVFSRISTV